MEVDQIATARIRVTAALPSLPPSAQTPSAAKSVSSGAVFAPGSGESFRKAGLGSHHKENAGLVRPAAKACRARTRPIDRSLPIGRSRPNPDSVKRCTRDSPPVRDLCNLLLYLAVIRRADRKIGREIVKNKVQQRQRRSEQGGAILSSCVRETCTLKKTSKRVIVSIEDVLRDLAEVYAHRCELCSRPTWDRQI